MQSILLFFRGVVGHEHKIFPLVAGNGPLRPQSRPHPKTAVKITPSTTRNLKAPPTMEQEIAHKTRSEPVKATLANGAFTGSRETSLTPMKVSLFLIWSELLFGSLLRV
ncbi:MAG: hypothetical protein COA36_10235 [Desulfotalea sp.]|nr:MAG: hypothetical protein COA36_10235 [Desulfotalea sp.]